MSTHEGDNIFNLFGINGLSTDTSESYAERRLAAAIDVAGLLSVRNAQLARQQTAAIGDFFENFVIRLNKPEIKYHLDRSVYGNGRYADFDRMQANFVFETGTRNADISSAIAKLTFLRAGLVWAKTPANDLFCTELSSWHGTPRNNIYSRVNGDIDYPYVVVGKREANEKDDDLLMLPLGPKCNSYDSKGNKAIAVEPAIEGYPKLAKAYLLGKSTLKVVRVGKASAEALFNAQEMLLDKGLTPEEIETAYDVESSTFTLASLARLYLKPAPKVTRRLLRKKEPIKDSIPNGFSYSKFQDAEEVTLPDFLSFEVLPYSQRSAEITDNTYGYNDSLRGLERKSPKIDAGTLLTEITR